MNSLVEILTNSLNIESIITPKFPNVFVNIKNSDNDGELKSVKVDLMANDDSVICLSFDNNKNVKLLNSNIINLGWLNKKSDGIIYKFEGNNHHFIIIEVKTDGTGGCKDQHNSMISFLTYLLKAIELENNLSIMNNVVFYKILITSRAPKGATNVNRGVPFNHKINANEIQYKNKVSVPIKLNYLLDCKQFSICKTLY